VSKQIVVFTAEELGPVLEVLDPAGWVNLQPEVADAGEDPTTSGFFAVFGARGPAVPFCTWMPGERSAGIQHGTGPKLASRIDVPAGWRVAQDHPRRGLVVRVPDGVADEVVLAWLLATGEVLCARPLLGRWVAEVHNP
jgi:hypothetical protein